MTEGLTRAGFDNDLTEGVKFETELQRLFSAGRVEVKTDHGTETTGNVFVEFRYRGMPSGIKAPQAEDADWWAIRFWSDGQPRWFLIPRRDLHDIACDILAERGGNFVRGGDYDRADGVLVPIIRLVRGR